MILMQMQKFKIALAGLVLAGFLPGTAFSVDQTKMPPKQEASANAGQPMKKSQAKTKKMAKKPAQGEMKKPAENAAATQAKAMYKCEHCNVTSDKPGKCSMCGM